MCKLNAALTHAQILYTLLLRKRLIPPKRRSHQSFFKLKKIGVSHAYFSFFVSFHLYRFGFSLLALLYRVRFLFFSKQIGCYFVCDSVHVLQEDGGAATTTSTFLPSRASLGLPSRPGMGLGACLLWVPRIT